jgi:hypothetical protein
LRIVAVDVSFDPPDLTRSIGRAVGGEVEAAERAPTIRLVRERRASTAPDSRSFGSRMRSALDSACRRVVATVQS